MLAGPFVERMTEVSWFRPKDLLDRTFEVGIILKGLNGLLELVGGLLLFVVTPATIDHLVATVTQFELSDDPHDFIAVHLLRLAHGLTGSAVLFAALYLLLHGVVKVVLVVAVLRTKLWAYPWMIALLGAFIVYQLYRLSYRFSIGLALLTVCDVFVVVLTVIEYRRRRTAQNLRGT